MREKSRRGVPPRTRRPSGWPRGIAPPGLPQIRTCALAHPAPRAMGSLRDAAQSALGWGAEEDSASADC